MKEIVTVIKVLLNTFGIFFYQGRYLGLGWSLSVTGDFLLIGAPYASVAGGEQNGAVFIISSNKSRDGKMFHDPS